MSREFERKIDPTKPVIPVNNPFFDNTHNKEIYAYDPIDDLYWVLQAKYIEITPPHISALQQAAEHIDLWVYPLGHHTYFSRRYVMPPKTPTTRVVYTHIFAKRVKDGPVIVRDYWNMREELYTRDKSRYQYSLPQGT